MLDICSLCNVYNVLMFFSARTGAWGGSGRPPGGPPREGLGPMCEGQTVASPLGNLIFVRGFSLKVAGELGGGGLGGVLGWSWGGGFAADCA